MIIAEGFECVVPSDDAAKGTVINCVGTSPDNYLVLGDLATWATAIFTLFLVVGAFMAWRKAKETLDQMRCDAGKADTRFKLDIVHRTSMEEQRRQDDALSQLLSASSDVIAATNVGLDAVYGAGMELRKANLRFVMAFEVTHNLEHLEEFCAVLTQVAKSHFANISDDRTYSKTMANAGFELLFRSSMALHRGEIDMPDFLDGLYTFVDDVKDKHRVLLGAAMYMDDAENK